MKSYIYDAVVVGSGFGGAFAAYSLAKAGLRTVLLERGGRAKRDCSDWSQTEILIEGRYKSPSPVLVRQYDDKAFRPLYPNEVVGGMSVFYGGASIRLREKDFGRWPICYSDLEAYYAESEGLLEVHGEAEGDVFEPPRSGDYSFSGVELTPPAQRICGAARDLGYRPFRIPLAINFRNSSRPLCIKCVTCDGFPCKINAKNDVTTTVLRQAQDHGLEIRADVIVARLTEHSGRIASVECVDAARNTAFSLSGRVVVLGAGAIHSPAILLRSTLEEFANRGHVGRFLMRHCNAVVTYLFPFKTNPENTFHKQICLVDFYEDFRDAHGCATGVIQDIYTPSAEVLKHFAHTGLKSVAGLASEYMQNLLCIAEDEPNFENSVSLSDEKDAFGMEIPKVVHQYSPRDYERRDYLVGKAKAVLRRAGGWIPNLYEIDTFSHAVGTLRFGEDPADSVLDPNCRFRGVDNLFVLDGSFMPTSGGVNPSLTIAANALRVSEHIVANSHGF